MAVEKMGDGTYQARGMSFATAEEAFAFDGAQPLTGMASMTSRPADHSSPTVRPNRKAGALAMVALLGAGAAAASWYYVYSIKPLQTIEAEVRARLIDPDSAKFEGVTFNRGKSVGCGFVNARNRMGGYIGRTHFVLFPDGDLRFGPNEDASTGDTSAKLLAAQQQSNYLTLVDSNCAKQ